MRKEINNTSKNTAEPKMNNIRRKIQINQNIKADIK
jgi:hypothetical protein